MVHFKVPPTVVVVVPAVKERDEPKNAFRARPVAEEIIGYRHRALAFFCAINIQGARSPYGQSIEPAILTHIAALAAPYIIDADIFEARRADDYFADDYLLFFQECYRTKGWWWHDLSWGDSQLDAKSSVNAGIFTGGIASVPHVDDDDSISTVFRQDNEGNNEYFVIVVERRGSVHYYIDLMVHASKTMRDVLRFLTARFRLHSDESTCMVLWGMCDDGTADLECTEGGLFLHSKHKSPMMDKTMGEMWPIIEKLNDDMVHLWEGEMDPGLGGWDENVQEHTEYWAIVRNAITLLDNV